MYEHDKSDANQIECNPMWLFFYFDHTKLQLRLQIRCCNQFSHLLENKFLCLECTATAVQVVMAR